MANTIGLMGESGSGKTTSLETLDPKTTFILNCDKKRLPFRKEIREQYSENNKNYFVTDNQATVLSVLKKIDTQDNMKHIKVVVVDTLNGLMVADEMRRSKEKGFDKWVDLAQCIWDLVNESLEMRDNLTIIFVCHSQTQKEDDGYTFTRIKTSGKKLDKLCIESKLTTVLHAVCEGGEYKFKVHADNSTAKTPMGAFETDEIDNDITKVLDALKEY